MKEGRLEFIHGGWVSADEACPTYEEQIMNIWLGHDFLKKTFGILPKHAWHVDAFGHSAATPELFAKMGFETISFSRIDFSELHARERELSLEFIWNPTYSCEDGQKHESPHSIFTRVMEP